MCRRCLQPVAACVSGCVGVDEGVVSTGAGDGTGWNVECEGRTKKDDGSSRGWRFWRQSLVVQKSRDGPLMSTISAWSFRPGVEATHHLGTAPQHPVGRCTLVPGHRVARCGSRHLGTCGCVALAPLRNLQTPARSTARDPFESYRPCTWARAPLIVQPWGIDK